MDNKTTSLTLETVVSGAKLLNDCKLKGVDGAEKYIILRAMRHFKPVGETFEAFVKTCQEKLKDEEIVKAEESAKRWEELNDDERQQINKVWGAYQKAIEECVSAELKKEADIPQYERLSEKGFTQLLDANPDWTIHQILTIESLLA